MSKRKSSGSKQTQADASGVTPGKGKSVAEAKTAPKAKPKRTRRFRGQECEITRTTRDTRTGAIYDYFNYVRTVTNRKTGETSKVNVGRRQRRPDTGHPTAETEVELTEEELATDGS